MGAKPCCQAPADSQAEVKGPDEGAQAKQATEEEAIQDVDPIFKPTSEVEKEAPPAKPAKEEQKREEDASPIASKDKIGDQHRPESKHRMNLRNLSFQISVHEGDLERVPKVAVMLAKSEEPGMEHTKVELQSTAPQTVRILAEADLKFYGSPRKLLIVSLRNEEAAGHDAKKDRVAVQLEKLRYTLDAEFHRLQPDQGPWMWPLHDIGTNARLCAIDALEFTDEDRHRARGRRLALWLHMYVPRGGGPLIHMLKDLFWMRNIRFRVGGRTDAAARWLKLIFVVTPTVCIFMILVMSLLYLVMQLNIWLSFGWGDCVRLGCYDPETLHGFVGWLSEVGSDIALAIVFEGLLALSSILGKIAADLHNYKYERDFQSTALFYSILLESVGKVVPYGVVALHFVPQWGAPHVDPEADCSDIHGISLFGDASMSCLVRRLPLATRRFALERSMKGPFMVAPFVAILVKVIIPWVADRLDLVARKFKCCRVCDGLAHLLALIFTYDGDMVNCLQYVCKGWPFTDLVVQSNSDEDSMDSMSFKDRERMIHHALQQSVRKPFEPLDELLELKLNFLWVLLFAPLRPAGVLFTIFARFLEVRAKLTKMLFVRRRVFPCQSRTSIMHKTQFHFLRLAVGFAIIWYLLLSLITYNDDLYKWHT